MGLEQRYCAMMPGEPIFIIPKPLPALLCSSAQGTQLHRGKVKVKMGREAISLKKKPPMIPCQEADKNIAAIEDQTDRLLKNPVKPAHKEAVTFQKKDC
jgi:hypothetical protein